jgi:RHH-type rel operon transcriptional repressor/antitoxin RelB
MDNYYRLLWVLENMAATLSIRLPADLARELDALCKDTERPRTFIVRKALESYLAEQADYQVALDRLRDKADPVLTTAEVRRSLDR